MSEANSRRTLISRITKQWPEAHVARIEDKFAPGIPDVNLMIPRLGEWWVECKDQTWPKRELTPMKVDFRPAQPIWLTQRRRAGGKVMVAVRLEKEWFFFNDHFYQLRDGVTREEWYKLALYYEKDHLLDLTQAFDPEEYETLDRQSVGLGR
jgi:hypothetical protein